MVVLSVVATGCGDDDVDVGDDPSDVGGLIGERPAGKWRLVSGSGADGRVPMVDGYDLTLDIDLDAGQVGGTAACNGYGGEVRTIADGTWIVDGYAWTEMGCAEPGVHESEQAYLSALVAVESYELTDDATLVLRGPATELRFVVVPPPPDAELVGTTWVLDTLLDGRSASSIVGMESSTMVLAPDGTFSAALGCNLTNGTWTLDGDRLDLHPVDLTDRPCTEPAQTFERHVLATLGDVGFELDGPRLTLLRDDGFGVDYRAAGAPPQS